MPKPKKTPEFNVIVDTREKKPWDLHRNSKSILNSIPLKVDVGDYAIEDLEDKLCIERKASVDELANNVFDSRFRRELEKMKDFPHKYLVFEFSLDDILDFPNNSKIAKGRLQYVKATPQYMMRFISEVQVEYGIDVVFCGNVPNAKYIVSNIMKRVVEQYVS